MSILICFGTRPEYIKVKSLIEHMPNVRTCFMGQHADLLKDVAVDYKLDMGRILSANRLNNVICNILTYDVFEVLENIEYVLVQGDTTSALAMALSAFNNQRSIIHLEAGLRSNNLKDPYPEEANRQVISRLADIHLCPTEFNKANLLNENVSGSIYVVGNTGLDNITKEGCTYSNKVLITLHRRDNHHMMGEWFIELEKLAAKYADLEFVLPLHPNPNVQKHRGLLKMVKVIEPMTHGELIDLLKQCRFVISDSGGLQEEASYLNKRIVVCRRTTERPESIGIHSVMCEWPNKLEEVVDAVYADYFVDENTVCPYGDGASWKRVVGVMGMAVIQE